MAHRLTCKTILLVLIFISLFSCMFQLSLQSWDAAFYALMVSCFLSAVVSPLYITPDILYCDVSFYGVLQLLGRLFVTEVIALHRKIHGQSDIYT